MKRSALADLVGEIKGDTKAARSASNTLERLINDYCQSGKFRDYLKKHRADAGLYLEDESNPPGRFRASSAGKCLQQQAFKAVSNELPEPLLKDVVKRTAENERALHNGTFMHMRYHLMFDALDEIGSVRTLQKEQRQYIEQYQLTGAFDRYIEFDFDGKSLRGIVDMKSMKQYYFGQLIEPSYEYEAQQHSYRLLNPDLEVDRWFMLYENKDLHSLKVFDRPYREQVLEELRKRYVLANEWVDAFKAGVPVAQLPKLSLDRTWCNWCDWQTVCGTINPL